MKIFFASRNSGKIREIRAVLANLPCKLLTADDLNLPADFDVEETGDTFSANAELKARSFAKLSKLPTLADDSGLLLAAFPGFPGIKSNRWFKGTDSERNLALLEKLKEKDDRSAFFQTTLCFYDPSTKKSKFFTGKMPGKIALKEDGNEGFGYDPIFIPENYDRSYAALGLELKNKISHRQRALRKFSDFLAKELS